MISKILSKKVEDYSVCYLCEITLKDFIENLPTSFMEYDIQRGVVSNIYLDNLVETVLSNSNIPPITLVTEDSEVLEKEMLKLNTFKILDGLQRTFRLKIIWDTIVFFLSVLDEEIFEFNKFQLSRKYGKDLQKLGSSIFIFEKIISYYKKCGHDKEILLSTFVNNRQWFIIWENLSPQKQVEKMLILNAGHKPVSIRHQLELLFINLIPYFSEHKSLTLIREKDMPSTTYGKRREVGQFHFAHIISSVLSFANGDTITTNASLINKLQEEENKIDTYKQFFTFAFLDQVVAFLVALDNLLTQQYGQTGTQWIGRETVMVGLFGAIGKLYHESNDSLSYVYLFNEFLNILNTHEEILNLRDYNDFRNSMDLSKVNVGNVSKKAIFNGIYSLLKDKNNTPIEWSKFEGASN